MIVQIMYNICTIPGEMFNKLGTLDFLSAHGARAVAIDMIGYGKSDPPIHIPETYEGFFAEVRFFINKLHI